jgi:protein ImuA
VIVSAHPAVIAELQEKIDRIGGGYARRRDKHAFGVPGIDDRIHGGLAFGCTHEIAGGGVDGVNGAASVLFAAGIAGRTKGPVFWCFVRDDLFPPALAHAGLDMGRVMFIQCKDEKAVLDSAEEIIRFGGVAACVAEVVRLPMIASRRLQLAAERSGTMALIVRRWRRQSEATDYGQPTASATRWRISLLPSEPLPVAGVGRPRWLVELMRARAGECFDIEVGACDARGKMAAIETYHEDRRFAR